MLMAMMDVRVVRMAVTQPCMPVHMAVRQRQQFGLIMVLMMRIMIVKMIVFDLFMDMFMLMSLGQV